MYLVCWSSSGGIDFLRWKESPRFAEPRQKAADGLLVLNDKERRWLDSHTDRYFGDPAEWDDYELAEPENAPSHWLPIPDAPKRTGDPEEPPAS